MRASLFRISKIMSVWIALVFISLLISAFAMPWVFDTIERVTGTTLPYEGALRLSLLFAHGILLSVACVYLLTRGTRRGWYIWIGFTLSFISLAVIFFGDTNNRLMNEYSWIRYTTSGLLFSAGLYGLYRAYQTRLQSIWIALLLALIGSAFIYAGLDELAQIHEKIGDWMSATFQLSSSIGDWITLTYALIGVTTVGFILYKGRTKLHTLVETSRFTALFACGAIVYLISTLFDTTDFVILGWLQSVIARLVSDSQFVVGDAWFLIWAPRNLINSMEEVLEHTAALLFMLAFFFLNTREIDAEHASERSDGNAAEKKYRLAAWAIASTTSLLTVLLIIFSIPDTFPVTPLTDGRNVERIAGKADGLTHTDDLEFNPAQGLLIGNENKGEVLMWRDGALTRLNDPDRVLGQVEGVAADEARVYASDGARGIIAEYNADNARWKVLWSRRDGLIAPEGLAFADEEDALYVLDESQNSITRLKHGEPPRVWKPAHPLWQAPEGIAFDANKKLLIVTDDVTGAVFAVRFGSSIKLLTRVSKAEDVTVLADGTIYFTENGTGSIMSLLPDGALARVARFHRAYRDTQGIALDADKNIYVVVSDGYNSESIMPSQLFIIKL